MSAPIPVSDSRLDATAGQADVRSGSQEPVGAEGIHLSATLRSASGSEQAPESASPIDDSFLNNAAAAARAPHVVPAASGNEPHVGVLGLTERAFKMTFEFETGTNSLDAVAIHDLVYHSEIGNQLRNALFPETSEAIVRHAMSTLEAHVDQMVNPAAALAPLPSPVPTGTAPRCSCPRPHL